MTQPSEKKESDIEFILRLIEMMKEAARIMERKG